MKATVKVNANFPIGEIDPRIYSGFVEHLGRAVYEGIYQPDHPTADEDGFRQDVLELVRELGTPLTRYPGGNFVSSYRWEDGIGPQDQRPVRTDFAWKSLEPNTVGIDEFMKWCRKANTEAIMAINLGTRGAEDAKNLMEYCNFPGGTAWSDLRKKNGSPEPYRIRHWCLGNEMDGRWQAGHTTARAYGALARESAKLMKLLDPDAQMILAGSSGRLMPTFPQWDREILEEAYDQADYISLHAYYNNRADDFAQFLTAPEQMAQQIETIIHTCDYVKAQKRSPKTMYLCFDEYNVWKSHGVFNIDKEAGEEWSVARPLLQDVYNMEDALVVGGLLMTLQNYAHRVKIACIAQTVNVIAPILTSTGGGAWRQTIFHPFALLSRYGRGTVYQLNMDVPSYECDGFSCKYLLASGIWNKERQEFVIYALNRSQTESMTMQWTLEHFQPEEILEFATLHHPDLKAVNTEDCEAVKPVASSDAALDQNTLTAELPPASWNMIRIRLADTAK